jgi:hypothetical protein
MELNFPFRKAFAIFFSIFIIGCNSHPWDAELGEKSADLGWQRFELYLFELGAGGFTGTEIDQLQENYPRMFPLYMQAIMRFGPIEDPNSIKTLEKFTADPNILELFNAVKTTYPEGELEPEISLIEKGLLRYRHFFPQAVIPQVKSMISAFTYSTAVDDSLLVVSLDNYLGKDFKLYPEAGIPEYKSRHFSRKYMVSDALKAWLLTDFKSSQAQNLLEQMIYQGKIIYLLYAFLPEMEEHVLLNYEAEQLQWCRDNSTEIWAHFLEMELLFTTENYKIRKYLGDAPFIAGFPEGSPGRVAQWLGYEIVKAYMERKKGRTLPQLMQINDANQILQQSKYKPQ